MGSTYGIIVNCVIHELGSFDLLAKDWPAGHRIVSIDFPGKQVTTDIFKSLLLLKELSLWYML